MRSLSVTVSILVLFSANAFGSGLVAYYPFSGNANDYSGFGNDGTVYGATLAADRFGNANSAYSFDGIDDYIDIFNTSNLNLTSWTISGWVKVNAFPDDDGGITVVGKHHNAESKYNYTIQVGQDGELWSGYEVDGDPDDFDHQVYGLNPISLDEWVFFTGVRNALTGEHAIYINGEFQSSAIWNDIPTTTHENLYIGQSLNDNGLFFSGLIDDIRIYDGVLSSDKIAALYTVPEPNTFFLLAIGFLGMTACHRIKKKR